MTEIKKSNFSAVESESDTKRTVAMSAPAEGKG